MRPYEVMVIFDAELEESDIRAALDRSTQLLKDKGAQMGTTDIWGKRRFAYRLKHRWEGYYVVLQARAEPAAMEELGRTLGLADEVIRHKILRIPEAVYGQKTEAPAQMPAPSAPVEAAPEAEGGDTPEAADAAPEAAPEAAAEVEPEADAETPAPAEA